MLDDDDVAVGSKQAADQTTGGETLLDIQEGGRLVEHVDVGLLDANHADSETLKLTAGQEVDVTVPDNVKLKSLSDLFESVLTNVASCGDEVANGSVDLLLERLGNLVDVLRLCDGLEVVLEDFREVVCYFLAPIPPCMS